MLKYLMNTSRTIQAMMSEGYSWMSGLFESSTGKLLKALSDLCCLDKQFNT